MTAPSPRGASSNRSPVLAVMSTLAALQVLTGGAALGEVLGAKAAGLCILAVAAAQTGLQFYVRGQVTPWSAVAASVDGDGSLVAGPAADVPTGALVAEVQAAPPRAARTTRTGPRATDVADGTGG